MVQKSLRARIARQHAKEHRLANPLLAILTNARKWDTLDSAAHSWLKSGRDSTKVRRDEFGDAALSLGARKPVDSIWEIDWSKATNFKRSCGGRSSGVYFVALPDDRIVVVKPDDESIADYCGSLLATYFGVSSPAMRLVRTREAEGAQIIAMLSELNAQKPLSERSAVSELFAAVPAILIMNFVAGQSLKGAALTAMMDPAKGEQFCRLAFGEPPELHAEGRARLRAIGAMMAYDIFIFNYDRLPCVFDNGGNTENIMLTDDGDVIAIDSMCSTFNIDEPKARAQFDAFRGRVAALVASVMAAPDEPHPSFGSVRTLLAQGRGDESSEAYCPPLGIDIGREGVLELQRGFLSTLPRFEALTDAALEALPRLVADHVGREQDSGFSRVRVDFLCAVRDVFRSSRSSAAPVGEGSLGKLIRWGGRNIVALDTDGTMTRLGQAATGRERGGSVSEPPAAAAASFETSAQLHAACLAALGVRPPSPGINARIEVWKVGTAVVTAKGTRSECAGHVVAGPNGGEYRIAFQGWKTGRTEWCAVDELTLQAADGSADGTGAAAAAAAQQAPPAPQPASAPEPADPPTQPEPAAEPAPAAPERAATATPVAAGGTHSLQMLQQGTPSGVDPAHKEDFLADEDFEKALGSPRATFKTFKPWKQAELKKATGLF